MWQFVRDKSYFYFFLRGTRLVKLFYAFPKISFIAHRLPMEHCLNIIQYIRFCIFKIIKQIFKINQRYSFLEIIFSQSTSRLDAGWNRNFPICVQLIYLFFKSNSSLIEKILTLLNYGNSRYYAFEWLFLKCFRRSFSLEI